VEVNKEVSSDNSAEPKISIDLDEDTEIQDEIFEAKLSGLKYATYLG